MKCPKCLKGNIVIKDYESLYVHHQDDPNASNHLDKELYCQLKCTKCDFEDNRVTAQIVYPDIRTPEQKAIEKFKEKFKSFEIAAQNLSDVVNNNDEILTEAFCQDYPFNTSFDDLAEVKIREWQQSVFDYLSKPKKKVKMVIECEVNNDIDTESLRENIDAAIKSSDNCDNMINNFTSSQDEA